MILFFFSSSGILPIPVCLFALSYYSKALFSKLHSLDPYHLGTWELLEKKILEPYSRSAESKALRMGLSYLWSVKLLR